jgi:putative acetyltransferase
MAEPEKANVAGVTIRPEASADFAAIREMLVLAFSQEFPRDDVATLVEALRKSPGYVPDLAQVAVHDGAVIGHVMFTHIQIESDSGNTPAMTLAPLAVHPTWHRQGVGSLLARHGLQLCHQLGHRIVTVIGHSSYYPRFGFIQASPLGIMMSHGRLEESKMVLGLTPDALDGVTGMVRLPSIFDDA